MKRVKVLFFGMFAIVLFVVGVLAINNFGLLFPISNSDVNNDGIVNIIDMSIVKKCLFQNNSGACSDSDINGDGKINIIDLGEVKKRLFYRLESCVEDDFGFNITGRGTLIEVWKNRTGLEMWRSVDECDSDGNLLEWECVNGLIPNVSVVSCGEIFGGGHSCRNGACVNQSESCMDSDGGLNYFVKGIAGSQGHSDYCFGNGTTNIAESYCSDFELAVDFRDCRDFGDFVCANGACVEPDSLYCNDTDGGENASEFGTVFSSDYPNGINDLCIRESTLREEFCSVDVLGNPRRAAREFRCSDFGGVCEDGACVGNQTGNMSKGPDLIISETLFEVDYLNFSNGSAVANVKVGGKVKNIGDELASGGTYTRFWIDSDPMNFLNNVYTVGLVPGGEVWRFYTFRNLGVGNYSVNITADVYNRVMDELDEGNNNEYVSFVVG
jgi:hypothetical protein